MINENKAKCPSLYFTYFWLGYCCNFNYSYTQFHISKYQDASSFMSVDCYLKFWSIGFDDKWNEMMSVLQRIWILPLLIYMDNDITMCLQKHNSLATYIHWWLHVNYRAIIYMILPTFIFLLKYVPQSLAFLIIFSSNYVVSHDESAVVLSWKRKFMEYAKMIIYMMT